MEITATQEVVTNVIASAPDNSRIIGQSLQITLIGMAILFVSLLIIWGVMELLVRFVKDAPESAETEENAAATVSIADSDLNLKSKAAAAAAGYVLSKKG